MAKYKVSVKWEGQNEVIEDFENEEDAKNYGYEELADGCGEVIVDVELIEEEEEEEEEEEIEDESESE